MALHYRTPSDCYHELFADYLADLEGFPAIVVAEAARRWRRTHWVWPRLRGIEDGEWVRSAQFHPALNRVTRPWIDRRVCPVGCGAASDPLTRAGDLAPPRYRSLSSIVICRSS
ncbi:hypothetical protein DF3PB_4640003 [uncultured Defluviicoccus sp.]|uniref:Uncharacterized protein n=1 Tax=metagenome TaxID=256318 RepID=A0A380TGY9_9ZZZZ|nr:hypothetical protein DF3PB_4640003 [uncultured Defluviicoccus sp.]